MLSAATTVPWEGIAAVTVRWGLVALSGVAYVVVVARRVQSQTTYQTVFEDRLIYVLLPLTAYATLVLGCSESWVVLLPQSAPCGAHAAHEFERGSRVRRHAQVCASMDARSAGHGASIRSQVLRHLRSSTPSDPHTDGGDSAGRAMAQKASKKLPLCATF